MMGIAVPKTCRAYKKYNKIISGISVAFILQLQQHSLHKNVILITRHMFRLKIFYFLLCFYISSDEGCLGPKQVAYC